MIHVNDGNEILASPAARNAQRLIFALSVIWYCWFLTPLPNWNIASRNALSSSIVLDHKLDIDRYHLSTGDIACVNGHYYSDKAPGISWMSLPALTAYSIKRPVEPRDPWQLYFMTLFTVAIPSCLLNVLLFRFSLVATHDLAASLLCSFSFAFATLAFPYATLLYSHQPVALILFSLFYFGYSIRTGPSDYEPPVFLLLLIGMLCGTLFITEYATVLPGAVIVLYFLSGLRGLGRAAKSAIIIAAAAIIPALGWVAYNSSVFGKFIDFGYHHECLAEFSQGMSQGVRGFSMPAAKTFYDLLILPGRGLFFISPALLLSIPGYFSLSTKFKLKAESFVCVVIAAITIALNVSIFQPSGGAALGPRYLVPMLPFCAFAACAFLAGRGRILLWGAAGVIAVSFLYMAAGTVTNPQPPRGIDSAYFSHINYFFIDGIFRPGLLSSISMSWSTVLLAPAALSAFAIILFVISINKKPLFKLNAAAFASFIFAFSLFAACSVYLGIRESNKLPVHIKELAVADYYKYLNQDKAAARHYTESFSLKYTFHGAGGNMRLWTVCTDIATRFGLHQASDCIYAAKDTGSITENDVLSFTGSKTMSNRTHERRLLLAFASEMFSRSPEIRAAYARELLYAGDPNGALKEAAAALELDPRNKSAAITLKDARSRLQ